MSNKLSNSCHNYSIGNHEVWLDQALAFVAAQWIA